MQITIAARHGHLSPASQEKISEKVGKLTRFFDRVTAIQVTVDLAHRESPEVEIRLTVEHSPEIVATDRGENVQTALDSAVDKLEKQLRKHKEKITGHHVAGHKRQEMPEAEPEGE